MSTTKQNVFIESPSPQITIVVIGYKHEAYIAQCLDSVAAQSIAVDLIIFDDASNDRTGEIVTSWLDAHPRQQARTVFHERNRGLTSTLNEAVSMISTPYFAYIAADDWMTAERSEVQLHALEQAGLSAALAYSDALRADEEGRLFEKTFAQTHPDVWKGASSTETFAALLSMNWIPAPTVMIRTNAIREIGGYDSSIFYEDHDVYLRLARRYKFVNTLHPLAVHRESDESYGHRMFFTDEGRRSFQRAQVDILIKHIDTPEARASDVIERLTARVIYLYRSGEPPAWIAPRAQRLQEVNPSATLRLIAITTKWGLPAIRPRRLAGQICEKLKFQSTAAAPRQTGRSNGA